MLSILTGKCEAHRAYYLDAYDLHGHREFGIHWKCGACRACIDSLCSAHIETHSEPDECSVKAFHCTGMHSSRKYICGRSQLLPPLLRRQAPVKCSFTDLKRDPSSLLKDS